MLNDTTIKFDDLSINPKQGLDADQVSLSTEKYGRNTLTPPHRDPWWKLLLEKFDDPTIRILIAAAVISLLMTLLEKTVLHHKDASFVDSIGIVLAVLLATLAGFLSEMKSAREFELLSKVKDDILIKVLRNGQIVEVSINDIVVGDLVRLDLGDKVPADGVMLEAMGLLIDQSVMTGESVPVEKHPAKITDSITFDLVAKIDDLNLVYRGTMVGDGHGMFLVTSVGDKTKLGQIVANLGAVESEDETPLTQKLSVLAKQISVVGVCSSMLIFMVMAISAIWHSALFTSVIREPVTLTALATISIVVGWSMMRLALRPFFASMDMELSNIKVQIVSSLPMMVAAFGFTLGVWGMIGSQANATETVALFRGLLTCFVVAVTIIVVAVPEGLPMMVTVSLAMNMMKMARENCLIRKLVASETIGSATIVCSDKTGTLTQNRMTVTWLYVGLNELDGTHFDSLQTLQEWPKMLDSISANSEATLHITPGESKSGGKEMVEGIGNPTECALLRFLHDAGFNYQEYREKYPRLWELSHNSQRKMSLILVDKKGIKTCFAKGAPEKLIDSCSHVLVNGNPEPIGTHINRINEALAQAASKALRVIALTEKAEETLCFDTGNTEYCLGCGGHTLVALIGIADPIRPEVAQAVETCKQAGVDVKMITGDSEPTAIAIAKQAGILSDAFNASDEKELVLTSSKLAEISDDNLPDIAKRLRVLARSTPMDKLRLVKAMHRQGEVVAMTGDGTNDAPALKFADVGVSMGVAGTEVAKEASDIVLVDDNFKSIVTGIWWGRTLYQNIQRFLQFQLSVNVVALTCALIGPLLGIPLPLTVPQLLWINIIMDTFAAIALSTEAPRANTMRQKPVSRDASIITPSMGVSILLNSIYQVIILFLVLYLGLFLDPEHRFVFWAEPKTEANTEALTVFFTMFVMFQFWRIFLCRSLRYEESPFSQIIANKAFILIVSLIAVVQVVMVQASNSLSIGDIFRTIPLSFGQWLGISVITATIIPVAWLIRMLIWRCGLESDSP